MILPALALAAQVALSPCPIEGVPGEARCGTYRVWEDRDAKQGRQIDLYRLQQQAAACAEWPRGRVSTAHSQPTRSAVPTLMLSGELDPVTPPSGGDEVLRTLANGAHVVIGNNGHPIGNAEACVGSIFAAFLERGSVAGVDRSCAAAIPPRPFLLSGPSQ